MSQILLCQGSAQRLPLADQSVHTICTSPPYLGLRSYEGLEPEAWRGGSYAPVPGAPMIEVPAWEGCLGNEETPALFVWHTLLWLRECWRVLRDDSVCWANLGDSFSSGGGYWPGAPSNQQGSKQSTNRGSTKGHTTNGYPQGSLLGIPQQVQLAAVADGWICRNDLVWSKISPMPESIRGWRYEQPACACVNRERHYTVEHPPHSGYESHGATLSERTYGTPAPACPTCHGTGRAGAAVLRRGSWRHTRSHEYVLMLCKQMGYFANGEVVREEASYGRSMQGNALYSRARRADPRDKRETPPVTNAGGDSSFGRNPRSVLTPRPSALQLDHYASYPPSLVEPLIKATCPAQCCAVCSTGYAPIVAAQRLLDGHIPVTGAFARPDEPRRAPANGIGHTRYSTQTTVGVLQSSCACVTDLPPVPGICLDPFAGASTTLLVARALGRHAIGVEASPTYVQLSRERLGLTALEAWEHGATAVPVAYTDLPLFAQEDA